MTHIPLSTNDHIALFHQCEGDNEGVIQFHYRISSQSPGFATGHEKVPFRKLMIVNYRKIPLDIIPKKKNN